MRPLLACLLAALACGEDRAVAIRIAWDVAAGSAGETAYGLNLFHAFNLPVQADARYRAGLQRMAPRLLRLHNGGQSGESASGHGIWDYANHRLDAGRIAALSAHWRGAAPHLMMNISGWPAWMDADSDGLLDEDQIPAYAGACAELVRLVNIDGKVGIRWWETSNERDGAYWLQDGRPRRMAELARVHAACAMATRAATPSPASMAPSCR